MLRSLGLILVGWLTLILGQVLLLLGLAATLFPAAGEILNSPDFANRIGELPVSLWGTHAVIMTAIAALVGYGVASQVHFAQRDHLVFLIVLVTLAQIQSLVQRPVGSRWPVVVTLLTLPLAIWWGGRTVIAERGDNPALAEEDFEEADE